MKREKRNQPSKRVDLMPDKEKEKIKQIASVGERLEKTEFSKWWREADKEKIDSEGKFTARDAGKLRGNNIRGWAVGEQIKRGRYTGKLCINVYTEFKTSPTFIDDDMIIPPLFEGCIVNVIESGPLSSRPVNSLLHVTRGVDPKARFRPIPGGVSVGHPLVSAGTLGCYCETEDEFDLILSNNHILANSNNANEGDKIIQPGRRDGGRESRDAIGELYDWIDLKFNKGINYNDAALARISDFHNVQRDILEIGNVRNVTCNIPVETEVQKMGRTTGYTRGWIDSYDLGTHRLDYGEDAIVYMKNAYVISPGDFSIAGDSGSIILDNTNRAVALLFGGGSRHTLAIPICKVMDDLKIEAIF